MGRFRLLRHLTDSLEQAPTVNVPDPWPRENSHPHKKLVYIQAREHHVIRRGRIFASGKELEERMPERTLFQRIADREIPSDILFEDELCMVIRDVDPKAPTHFLVIPRKPIASLDDLGGEDGPLIGHLFLVAKKVAVAEGLSGGYRTVFNCGADAHQTVPHIHLHVLGGRKLGWPPG